MDSDLLDLEIHELAFEKADISDPVDLWPTFQAALL